MADDGLLEKIETGELYYYSGVTYLSLYHDPNMDLAQAERSCEKVATMTQGDIFMPLNFRYYVLINKGAKGKYKGSLSWIHREATKVS